MGLDTFFTKDPFWYQKWRVAVLGGRERLNALGIKTPYYGDDPEDVPGAADTKDMGEPPAKKDGGYLANFTKDPFWYQKWRVAVLGGRDRLNALGIKTPYYGGGESGTRSKKSLPAGHESEQEEEPPEEVEEAVPPEKAGLVDDEVPPPDEQGPDTAAGQPLRAPKVAPSPFREPWHKSLFPYATKGIAFGTDRRGRRYCMIDGKKVSCNLVDPEAGPKQPKGEHEEVSRQGGAQAAGKEGRPRGADSKTPPAPKAKADRVSMGFDTSPEWHEVATAEAWGVLRAYVAKLSEEEYPELSQIINEYSSDYVDKLTGELGLVMGGVKDPELKKTFRAMKRTIEDNPEASVAVVASTPPGGEIVKEGKVSESPFGGGTEKKQPPRRPSASVNGKVVGGE